MATFSQELFDDICERIAKGESLRSICTSDGMPVMSTVMKWLADDDGALAEQYARAREMQADFYFDQIVEIADAGEGDASKREDGTEVVNHDHIQRAKLRVDARKWVAGKLRPKKYGERQHLEHSGEGGGPVVFKTVYEAPPD